MPFALDEEAMSGKSYERQGRMVTPLLQMENGKPPVKEIPFKEYPRVVYKHPQEPFRVIEHRNANFELVGTERVASEHLSKVVADEAELTAALEDGWVKEPYAPKPLPDPNANLYEAPKKTTQGKR